MSLILAISLIVTAAVIALYVGARYGAGQHQAELELLRHAAKESQSIKADVLREIAEVQKSREVIKRDFEKAHGELQAARKAHDDLLRAIEVERNATHEKDEAIALLRQQLGTREEERKTLSDTLAATEERLKATAAQLSQAEKDAAGHGSLKKQLEMAKRMNEQGLKQRQELQAELEALKGQLTPQEVAAEAGGNGDALASARETIEQLRAELEAARAAKPTASVSLIDAIDADPNLNAGQRETVRMIVGRFLGKRD